MNQCEKYIKHASHVTAVEFWFVLCPLTLPLSLVIMSCVLYCLSVLAANMIYTTQWQKSVIWYITYTVYLHGYQSLHTRMTKKLSRNNLLLSTASVISVNLVLVCGCFITSQLGTLIKTHLRYGYSAHMNYLATASNMPHLIRIKQTICTFLI